MMGGTLRLVMGLTCVVGLHTVSLAEGEWVNIANCAKLLTSPPMPASVAVRLMDGAQSSAAPFPVGSKGPGRFVFTFPRERVVSGLRFVGNSGVYFVTRYRVVADLDGDGTPDKTLAEQTAASVGEVSFCQWQPVALRGLELSGTEGVAKGQRAFPALAEIEILGTPLPTDNEDARRLGNPVTQIYTVRPLGRWIDLSGRDRPVAITYPPSPGYAEAAATIARNLQRRGAKAPTLTSKTGEALPDRFHVIALENVNNNELIARLYFNRYAYEDSLVPGQGGYTVRTVYDPYPWHGKGDVIVVGASDDVGTSRGASALINRLRDRDGRVGLDYCLVVSSTAPVSESERKRLASITTPHYRTFLQSAEWYLKTGAEEYARHAISTLDRIARADRENGEHRLDWQEETSSDEIMATWDAFEECPLMSDEQRRRFTLGLLRFLRTLPHRVSGYSGLGNNDLVTWNHTTFPLMGLYFGARYFFDYYGLTECERHLAKARACMKAQARSWKPQEDSDGYFTITMRHAYEYCLAEWDLEFFKSGLMRRYADYAIGICDSAGLPSGFGDSGIGLQPRPILAALPIAFWYYRDPGYVWVLKHATKGEWRNQFHRDVEPKQDNRHVGVTVFPLDPQLYAYTTRQAFYNEGVSPPNVPLERAFDKIAFRQSWDRNSQYMILDGFSRGKHLHYDSNAILEYVDKGHRRLIDHDYLSRNTTEHNMVSVLRDGRADRLVPSCAGLRCAADVGGRVGLVGTELIDYLGMDCRRYAFWQKGDFFVVMDQLTARQPGDYDADIVWKVQDRGTERITSPGRFVAPRIGKSFKSRNVPVVEDDTASGSRAVAFDDPASVLSFLVEIPPGQCSITLDAYGLDTSSDSFFVAIDGGERRVVSVPKLKYGPSSATFDLRSSTPKGQVQATGRHLVTISLRERPPVRLDRLTFRPSGGGSGVEIEAESVQRAGPSDVPPAEEDRFWIQWADPVAATITRTTPQGIVVPVCKLWQRLHGRLETGQTMEASNLLDTEDGADRPVRSIARVGRAAVLVDGQEPLLLAAQGAAVNGLRFDAKMLFVSSSRIAWAGGRTLSLGTMRVTAKDICDLEIDVKSASVLPTDLDVRTDGLSETALRSFLTQLPTAQSVQQAESDTAGAARATWKHAVKSGPVRRIKRADLDGDGRDEILVAAGTDAWALTQRGEVLWSHRINGVCHDVAAGELDARAGKEVIVAGGDAFVHMLGADGHPLRKQQIRGPQWNSNFGDRPWEAYTVEASDLDNDGDTEIVVGTQSYELRLYDAQLREAKRTRQAVLHGSIDFHILDADGDGKQEIFATDHYGYLSAYDHTGSSLLRLYTSIGDMQAVIDDLDGDGLPELVYGSSTGDLHCARFPRAKPWARNTKVAWRFDNFGYAVNRLRAADLDGDGRREVIVASQTGYVYVLDAAGKEKWRRGIGGDVVEALVLRGGAWRLACFDRQGKVTFLSADGTRHAAVQLGFQPRVAALIDGAIVVGGTESLVGMRAP